MKYPICVLATLLWAVPAAGQAEQTAADTPARERQDPHEGSWRAWLELKQSWIKADDELEQKLPSIGYCGYEFRSLFQKVNLAFASAIDQKKKYYDRQIGSLDDDLANLDRFQVSQTGRKAEMEANRKEAEEMLASLDAKKTALLEGSGNDHAKVAAALQPLEELIKASRKSVEEISEALANWDEATVNIDRKKENLTKLRLLAVEHRRGVISQRLLWQSYYDLRTARMMVSCDPVIQNDDGRMKPGRRPQNEGKPQ